MRFLSIILFLSALTASAASFGPELPLTPISPAGAAQELPHLSMPHNGTVALWNGGATYGGRIDDRQAIPASRALELDLVVHRDGAVASIGDESMAAWVEDDWVYVRRIGSDGNPIGDNFNLATVDSRHTMRMTIGASSRGYLVVWPVWTRILSTLLDAQGNLVSWDTQQAQVTSGDYPLNVDKVAVASNGAEFLVVWEATLDEPWVTSCSLGCPNTDREVHAVIVGADGVAQPLTETVLATSAGMPDVVWNGSTYLVVWTVLPNGGIAGRQIAPGLASMGPVQTFSTQSDFGPAIAWDGTSDIVAFARAGLTSQDPAALMAIRVGADGAASPVSASALFTGALPRQYALAADGARVAIAYTNAGRIDIRYYDAGSGPARVRSVHH
jgi:hypothetical protein